MFALLITKQVHDSELFVGNKTRAANSITSRCRLITSAERSVGANRAKRPICLQDMLFTPEYILQKVFRKDGPPLGVDFDSLPVWAFKLRAGELQLYNVL